MTFIGLLPLSRFYLSVKSPCDLKHFVTEAMSIRRGKWHQSAAVLELQPVELQHLPCLREGTTGTLNTCLGSKCNSGAQMNV